MKQVIRRGLKEIIVDEVPDPVVTTNHVLIRPLSSLISSGTETASIHTDSLMKEVADNPSHLQKIWNVMKSMGPVATVNEVRAKFSEYAVLGYSGAGVIAAKHDSITDLKIGDRVAYGGEGTGHGESILVGRNLAARIPENVPFEHACFATLGSIAMNAIRIAQIGLGDVVAVIGQGLVGQLIAQLAKAQGAVVIAVDLKNDRVELAKKLGADHGLIGGSGLRESVLSVTSGRGVDCAFIAAAAKSDAPCRQALEITRDRGRMVVVGAVEMSFPWNDMYLKEIQLYMSRAYGPGSYDPLYERKGIDYPLPYVRWTENRNMEEFLRLIATGRVNVESLITHRYPLEDAARAYETILTPASNSLAVVLSYPAASEPDPVAAFTPKHKIALRSETTSGTLRVALAGAGNLAKWAHLPVLKEMPGVSIQAIHSASGARGKSYGLRFGAAACVSDYREILDDPDIDVVLIATRNQEHATQAAAALRAGKHVFVEKPMALTVDECRDLIAAVKESGKQLTVGFNRRYAPFYVELKNQLKRRTSPAVVHARVNSPGISGAYWMADPSIGGAILGEACHFTDLFTWLLDSEPLSVSAYSLPTTLKEPIGENNIAASFRFADGSVANLTYCTVGSKTSGGERVEAFAQGIGVASEDFKSLTIAGGTRTQRSKWIADKGYKEQLEAFLGAIRKGSPAEVNVYDGARSTLCCLKMLESAKTLAPREIHLQDLE
jgi:predicted dehydrogenase